MGLFKRKSEPNLPSQGGADPNLPPDPFEELDKKARESAAEPDAERVVESIEFKKGDWVKVLRRDGRVEGGWKVMGLIPGKSGAEDRVYIVKEGDGSQGVIPKYPRVSTLREWQTL